GGGGGGEGRGRGGGGLVQRVVVAGGGVVRRPPVGVHLAQLLGGERSCVRGLSATAGLTFHFGNCRCHWSRSFEYRVWFSNELHCAPTQRKSTTADTHSGSSDPAAATRRLMP